MSNRAMLPIGDEFYGYTIEKYLGSGAFANVYLASKTNASGKHLIALKHIVLPNEEYYNNVLRSMEGRIEETNMHFETLFNNIIQEITTFKTLSLKSNNHIITYYDNDVKQSDNPLRYDVFIKMEYATPITKQLEEKQLTVEELLKLCEHILLALKVCHDNGVIHRDIKDDNIFINSDGMYKIADFGVSTLLKKNERAKTRKGTPAFIAPEVMDGGQNTYDHTVDLYSLGIVLYTFFNSNRLPLLPNAPQPYTMEDNEIAVANRIKGVPLPAPSNAPTEVAQFILKMCAPRQQRFNNTDEALSALQEVKSQLTEAQLNEVVLTLNVTPKVIAADDPKESVEKIHEGLDLFNQSSSQNNRVQNQVAQLNGQEHKDLGYLGVTKGLPPVQVNSPEVEKAPQHLFETNKDRISNNEFPSKVVSEQLAVSAFQEEQQKRLSPPEVEAQKQQKNVPPVNSRPESKVLPIKENYNRGKSSIKVWPYVAAIGVLIGIAILMFLDVFLFIEGIPVVSTIFNRYLILSVIAIALIIVLFMLGKKLNAPSYTESLYVRFKGTEAADELVTIQTNLNFGKSNPAMNQEELQAIDTQLSMLIKKIKHAGDFGLNNVKLYEVEKEISDEIDLLNQKVKMYTVSSGNGKELLQIIERIQLLLKKRMTLSLK